MTQQEIESKLQVIKNNKMLPEKQKGMLIDKYEKMLSDLSSITETEKKPETQKPKSTKIKQKVVIDESCDDLREEAKERKARALAAAEKRKNAPKKSETTRNKEAIEKASERVENSINRRVKTKSVNVDEIEDLIDEYEEAIEKLKELLDLAKKSKMKYGGGIDNKEVEKLVLNARGIKDNHCGCNDKMRRGGYTTEMKYVNKNEDYEVRYAKNKTHRRGYNSSNKMADGGVIGESIRFKDWRGDVRTGEIVSILRNGDYEVSTDRGMALVTNDEIVKMRKGGSIPKGTYLSEAGMSKKMAKGGSTWKHKMAQGGVISKSDVSKMQKINIKGFEAYMPGIRTIYFDQNSGKFFYPFDESEFFELKNDYTLGKLNSFLKEKNITLKTKMAQGGGVKAMKRGGVMGDIYSVEDTEQFKQIITVYNELSEKFGVVNYFIDHNDNSVVFLMKSHKNNKAMDLNRYVNSLQQRGFNVFDKTQDISIKKDNGENEKYYFKLKLSKNVEYSKGGGVGKFNIGDVVANKKHKTIGIVRDVFDRGEVRTDADGVVDVDDLEIYSPSKHKTYHIAPSTKKEIDKMAQGGGEVDYFSKTKKGVKFLFKKGDKINVLQIQSNGKLGKENATILETYPAEQSDGTFYPFYWVVGSWDKDSKYPSLYSEDQLVERHGNKPKMAQGGGVDSKRAAMTKKISGELDKLGVQYKVSQSKIRLFDEIIKPANKSDEFYDKFDRITDLYNLQGVVKSKMAKGGNIEVGDTIRLKTDLPYMASLSSLMGKDLEVVDVKEVYFASGTKKFYHVIVDGDKHEVNEDFVEHGKKMAEGGSTDDYNSLTRGEIENKIEGLKLRIAKTKKQISGYETTERGKYNKLFQEKVVSLQKELNTLSDLWGKSKYEKGGSMGWKHKMK